MVEEFNKFRDLEDTLNNLSNRVIRGAVTKANTLLKVEAVFDAIQSLAGSMKTFYTNEPGQEEFRGMQILFGPVPFLNNIQHPYVDACPQEASENNPLVALIVNENIDSRDDIPLLQQSYAAAMQLFADINGI